MNYIVEPGDTIQSIANKFNIRVIDLVKVNDLKDIYYLEPGLEIIIPKEEDISDEIIDDIKDNNINNDINNTASSDKDDISDNSLYTYYTVKKNDNLYKIGSEYNISSEMLANINGLELNEYIFPDQKLLVPKKNVTLYITEDGDTIKSVTENLKTSPEEIIMYNNNIYLLPEQLIAVRKNNISQSN